MIKKIVYAIVFASIASLTLSCKPKKDKDPEPTTQTPIPNTPDPTDPEANEPEVNTKIELLYGTWVYNKVGDDVFICDFEEDDEYTFNENGEMTCVCGDFDLSFEYKLSADGGILTLDGSTKPIEELTATSLKFKEKNVIYSFTKK